MQAIASENLTWIAYPGQRATTIQYQAMFQGTPRAPDNFELSIIRMRGPVFSPKHRHNFDQFRVPFSGPYNQSPRQDIPQNQLGFIAEGARYGPQELPEGLEFLILQFGGASGDGYMSQNELMQGTNELNELGSFERGIFHRRTVEGQPPPKHPNQDAYEAVWEHVNGKKIHYAVPRYREPITINPEAFAWMPVEGSKGVATKLLGTFNERGTAAYHVRLAPHASHTINAEHSRKLLVVLDGAVEHGGNSYSERSAFNLARGESVVLQGSGPKDAVIFVMQLPRFP